MFDIGWQELFVIAVVALIVIGPKDLPRAIRAITHWIGKIRGLARDFQSGLDEVVREAELDDIKKQIDQVSQLDLEREIQNTIDPTGEATKAMSMDDVHRDLDKSAQDILTGEIETPKPTPSLPAPEPKPADPPAAAPDAGKSNT